VAARIKIAYIIGSLRTGGAEGQLLELLRGLDRHIFDPSLILFRPDTSSRAEGVVDQVYSIGDPKNSGLVDRSDLLKFPSFLLRTRDHLRHIQPDILHAFLPEAVTIVGSLAARAAGVPLIVASRRGSAGLYRLSRFLTAAERYALRQTDFMLANSAALAREIVDLDSYPAERAATIYNGVDTRRFTTQSGTELRRALGWSDEHVVFGIVANFRPCKRHADFVSAAERLHREFPHTRFVMCGHDRGELPRLTKQIADAGLRDVFHIITSDEPAHTIYPLIDVYICSSETEGFSNSVLEAMACGKPVIATRVGGNAEAVRDRIDGYLVSPHDPGAIAAAAKSLVQNSELRKKMSSAARQRAATTFSLDFMVKNHQQLYLQLLSVRGLMPEQSKAGAS
jgi:glycosyltransferase involved in cell wall biosynthesis